MTTLIPSNDSKYATSVPVSLSEAEFEALQSLSSSAVKYKQINSVIHRIKICKKRLQLRFPTVFRNGIILQFLSQYISKNDSIRTIACGLQSQYVPGFYALADLLALRTVNKFNFRINDLRFAPRALFDALRTSKMERFHIRFDDISDSNIERLCSALADNASLKELVFGAPSLSAKGVESLGALCGRSRIERLSVSIKRMHAEQMAVICDGLRRSESISVLDVEDSEIGNEGMKPLTAMLREHGTIRSLTIGNNGDGAMQSFFEEAGGLRFIEKLICNESQLQKAEHLDLAMISRSLLEMARHGALCRVQLPLFIFDDTDDDALELFVAALSGPNRIDTLQLFPLFDHLDRGGQSRRGMAYHHRISLFFKLLFDGLAASRSLKRLYIEMIGSESTFFTESVADSFQRFLTESAITELYVPFVVLADLRADILSEGFPNCTQLVSVKDDTTDYHWLDRDPFSYSSRYRVGPLKRAEMVKSKKYHQIAHRQCQLNIVREVVKHLPVDHLAVLVSTFCGFEADPEHWMR